MKPTRKRMSEKYLAAGYAHPVDLYFPLPSVLLPSFGLALAGLSSSPSLRHVDRVTFSTNYITPPWRFASGDVFVVDL